MRTFTILRMMLLLQKDIMQEITQIREQLSDQDNNILVIFDYLKQFEEARQQESEQKKRPRIGYKTGKE